MASQSICDAATSGVAGVNDKVSSVTRGGDLAESGRKRGRDRVAYFLHLRDLVYLHPQAVPAGAVSHVKMVLAAIIAEKATREKRLAERDEHRREADRQKAAAASRYRKPGAVANMLVYRNRKSAVGSTLETSSARAASHP
jgi:hypothetical protein